MPVSIIEADLGNPAHAVAVTRILDQYAHDPLEGGEGLPATRLHGLVSPPTADDIDPATTS